MSLNAQKYYKTSIVNGTAYNTDLINTVNSYNSTGTTTGYGNMGSFATTTYAGEISSSVTGYKQNGIDIGTSLKLPYIELITAGNGTITIPSGCTAMRVIMIGSGGGGCGGGDSYYQGTTLGFPAGAYGYAGGSAGYTTYVFSRSNTSVNTFNYTVGAGGAGSANAVSPTQASSGQYSGITFNGVFIPAGGSTGGNAGSNTSSSGTKGTCITASNLYGNADGNTSTTNAATTTNSPTASLPYMSSYGNGGAGGAGGAGGGKTGNSGSAGNSGYIRVYYLY